MCKELWMSDCKRSILTIHAYANLQTLDVQSSLQLGYFKLLSNKLSLFLNIIIDHFETVQNSDDTGSSTSLILSIFFLFIFI